MSRKVQLHSSDPEPLGPNGIKPMGFNAPGLIQWAKAAFEPRDPGIAFAIAACFGLKNEVAVALLSGEVDYTVDDEEKTVTFFWPTDPRKETK